MAYLAVIDQQPNDRRDYDIDFSEWFPEGDIVNDAVLSVTPAGLDVAGAIEHPRVKVWISGGTSMVTYKVTVLGKASNLVGSTPYPSNANRYKEVELKVRIKDN